MQYEFNSKSVRSFGESLSKQLQVAKPQALEAVSKALGYKNFDALSGVLKKQDGMPTANAAGKGEAAQDAILVPKALWTLVSRAIGQGLSALDEASRVVDKSDEKDEEDRVYCVYANELGVLRQAQEAIDGLERWAPAAKPQQPEKASDTLTGLALPASLYLQAYGEDGPDWARVELTPALLRQILDLQSKVKADKLSSACVDTVVDFWQGEDTVDDYRMECQQMEVTDRHFFFKALPRHSDDECTTAMVDIGNLLCILRDEQPDEFNTIIKTDRGVFTDRDLAEQIEEEDSSLQEGQEVWWFDPANNHSSGLYRVTSADHPDVISLKSEAGSEAEAPVHELHPIDRDAVAEWVGQHYKRNFSAEPAEKQLDWIERYIETVVAPSREPSLDV